MTRTPVSRLVAEIDDALQLAEDVAHSAVRVHRHRLADQISDGISAGLLESRTYAEAGMAYAPEVAEGIATATATASDLADEDPEFGRLLSALRRLRETAHAVSGARRT